MLKLLKFLLFSLMFVLLMFVHGYTIVKLWSWFIAPTFNIIFITIGQAMGISLFFSYFKNKNVNDEAEDFIKKWVYEMLSSGTVLILGFIIKTFII